MKTSKKPSKKGFWAILPIIQQLLHLVLGKKNHTVHNTQMKRIIFKIQKCISECILSKTTPAQVPRTKNPIIGKSIRSNIVGRIAQNPFFEGFFEALFQPYFNPDIRVSWFLCKNWPLFQIWVYYLKNWRIPSQMYLFIS